MSFIVDVANGKDSRKFVDSNIHDVGRLGLPLDIQNRFVVC
jgi:hypothetical protein